MKIKRYKHAKKVTNFYFRNFNFHWPHQVLFDGTFTNAALVSHCEIRDQLQKYLGGQVRFMTSSCALHETKSLGHKLHGAFVLLSSYETVECRHTKPIIASECFRQLVKDGNTNHYFVATQDPDLTRTINKIPGVPLLYISGKTIILEKPSLASIRTADKLASKRSLLTSYEQETLQKLKGSAERPSVPSAKRKRRGPKEPNPLSVKKKQKRGVEGGSVESGTGRKRKRRKRVKIAQHVKDELSGRQTEG